MDEGLKTQGKGETEDERIQRYKDHEKWRDEIRCQNKSDYDNSYKFVFKLMLLLNSGGIVISVANFLPKFTGKIIPLCYSIPITVILVIFSAGLVCAFYVAIKDYLLIDKFLSDFVSLESKLINQGIDDNEFKQHYKQLKDKKENEYGKVRYFGIVSFIAGFVGSIFLLLLTIFLIFNNEIM